VVAVMLMTPVPGRRGVPLRRKVNLLGQLDALCQPGSHLRLPNIRVLLGVLPVGLASSARWAIPVGTGSGRRLMPLLVAPSAPKARSEELITDVGPVMPRGELVAEAANLPEPAPRGHLLRASGVQATQ
jgi:hypothetical protein